MGEVAISTTVIVIIGVALFFYFLSKSLQKSNNLPKPQDDQAKLIAAITAAIKYHKQK